MILPVIIKHFLAGQDAQYPVLERAAAGGALHILAPNNGAFPAGGGVVRVVSVGCRRVEGVGFKV